MAMWAAPTDSPCAKDILLYGSVELFPSAWALCLLAPLRKEQINLFTTCFILNITR